MLINMKDLLHVAQANKFGVGAFNIASAEFARLVIEVAEAQRSPVIMEIHPEEHEFVGDAFIGYLRELASNASVPVVIHQDHGQTFEHIMRAIRTGYTSVMIDASAMPLEENIALTRRIVEVAHAVNVSVEAELGTIGVALGSSEGGHNEILFTDPAQAEPEDPHQPTGPMPYRHVADALLAHADPHQHRRQAQQGDRQEDQQVDEQQRHAIRVTEYPCHAAAASNMNRGRRHAVTIAGVRGGGAGASGKK